ncbi:MAG: hypothetical protein IJ219_00730 [Bacteroidaceae bacterium]|nr:hypothetical protein [Bacteroidaceae bacterium]MBQ9293437.1 hypothetical protein [Bacteroidaceae bacterium]
MKKMMYFAAFAIMMAMGNMNANAKVSAKNDIYHVNERGIVVAHHGDHGVQAAPKLSKHERKMIEERRRQEELRRMEEARRLEEMRRMEAHRRQMERRYEANRVVNNVAAGLAAGATVAAFVSALMR